MDEPVGGSVRLAPLSKNPAQRIAEIHRQEVEAEEPAAEKRAALFGGATDQAVSWIDMPLSKMSFGWRADGYVAQLPTEDRKRLRNPETDTQFDGERLWGPWTGPESGIHRIGEVLPGDSAGETWWLACGEVYPHDTVSCWLADNSDVPVTRLGCWWIVEYVSRPQTLFLRVNEEDVDWVRPIRPAYLRTSAHPYNTSTQDPRA